MPINFSGSSTFSGPAFAAYGNAPTTFPNSTWTKVNFDTKFFDTNNNFSTANSRFTPTVPGYYQLNSSAQLELSAASPTGTTIFGLYMNGVQFQRGARIPNSVGATGVTFSTIVSANGSSDYFEMWIIQGSGGGAITESSGVNVDPQFSASYIRSL